MVTVFLLTLAITWPILIVIVIITVTQESTGTCFGSCILQVELFGELSVQTENWCVLLVAEMVLKTPSFLYWTSMYTNNNVTHLTPRAPDLTILTNVNTILSFMSWTYLAQYTEIKFLKALFIPLGAL